MNEYQLSVPVPRKDGPHEASSRNYKQGRNHHHHHHRHHMMDEDTDDAGGDRIKCTGKSCRSCTAGLIADCIAICCCPCAVVNILAFALIKVPWTMGKRVLKMGKNKVGGRKKKKNLQRKRANCLDLAGHCGGGGGGSTEIDGGASRPERGGSSSELVFCDLLEDHEEIKNNFSTSFVEDEDELWFELYQVGHLGFGRVSFTGIPSSLWKDN
ncbi:hypothetical protein M9H77_15374 [Catharanthus roseus]|uniref:Uncharacterized protein n=1 Tax=Catharanthus roseus TaxID=4058 RepID=A0ACC0B0R4_CATRO|nr:hypothetical protein M9H77_15374 [Catharanthus roseus]